MAALIKTNNKLTKTEKRELQNQADAVVVKDLAKTKIVSSVFTEYKSKDRNIPYGILFMICIFTVAALFITFLNVRVNEVNNEISALNTQLADVREQTADAKAALSEKKDLTEIRKAAEAMGMVRQEYLPSHFLSISAEDKVVVYEEEQKEQIQGFASLLSALQNSISSFIEYIR